MAKFVRNFSMSYRLRFPLLFGGLLGGYVLIYECRKYILQDEINEVIRKQEQEYNKSGTNFVEQSREVKTRQEKHYAEKQNV